MPKTKECKPHEFVPLAAKNNVECNKCGFVRHRHPVDEMLTFDHLKTALSSTSHYTNEPQKYISPEYLKLYFDKSSGMYTTSLTFTTNT